MSLLSKFCDPIPAYRFTLIDLFEKIEEIPTYPGAKLFYQLKAITCPNPECRKLFLQLDIKDETKSPPSPYPSVGVPNSRGVPPALIEEYKEFQKRTPMNYSWRLLPKSSAKKFPDYVPKAVIEDYEEACMIADLSPKASATLSRRCLQTIIRNFWEIKNEARLKDEIDALVIHQDVSADIKQAFHSLRKIGNIGAHMEKNVNEIVNIEPEEARILIQFIENLIGLTYIEKHTHAELLNKINNISENKEE